MNIIYLILAIFGLGFLVFIHELGHYFMAIYRGMKVEVFSIGFGKPIHTWHKDGVEWRLCMLPFGGYVRIAGMEKKGNVDPRLVPQGFYSKGPMARVQVALAGPIVNIIFSLLAFSCIWFLGGRLKPFSTFTQMVGWVDETSSLQENNLRPGDVIAQYGDQEFHGYTDLLYANILKTGKAPLSGYHVNYLDGTKIPYKFVFDPQKELRDLGPASYLIYDYAIEDSPVIGLEKQDRIVWVNGELVFSQPHLSRILNDSTVLLSVMRDGRYQNVTVPRVYVRDMRLASEDVGELDDWRHIARLETRVHDLYFIPYHISSQGVVEGVLSYLDEKAELATPIGLLETGDKIVAIDGVAVSSAPEIISNVQTKRALIIVQRGLQAFSPPLWENEDRMFYEGVSMEALQTLVHSIGQVGSKSDAGTLRLLPPIALKKRADFIVSQTESVQNRVQSEREQIESIKDPKQRAAALSLFEKQRQKFMLGIQLQDRLVVYNPGPFALFAGVCKDTARTLTALITGNLNPKWMSGPIGIVQVIHYSWAVGIKEALFWMGVISLNLGLLNLLPLPVLDGGHIVFALVERVRGKALSTKVMDRLIFPFVLLLIGFFIFVTYHDLLRLLSRWF